MGLPLVRGSSCFRVAWGLQNVPGIRLVCTSWPVLQRYSSLLAEVSTKATGCGIRILVTQSCSANLSEDPLVDLSVFVSKWLMPFPRELEARNRRARLPPNSEASFSHKPPTLCQPCCHSFSFLFSSLHWTEARAYTVYRR